MHVVLFLNLFLACGSALNPVKTNDTKGMLGDDVNLKCELAVPRNVLQVTWQKIIGESTENIATYSERFGCKVTEKYHNHVILEKMDLKYCSIIIKNVTKEDEGCYKCLFNSYPNGAVQGKTCVSVYEMHTPILEIQSLADSDKEKELAVLTCSATGLPAPTISWKNTESFIIIHQPSFIKNLNGTVTVTQNVTLSRLRLSNIKEVTCIAVYPDLPRAVEKSLSSDFISHCMAQKQYSTSEYKHEISRILLIVFGISGFLLIVVVCIKKKNELFARFLDRKKYSQNENACETPANSSRENVNINQSGSKMNTPQRRKVLSPKSDKHLPLLKEGPPADLDSVHSPSNAVEKTAFQWCSEKENMVEGVKPRSYENVNVNRSGSKRNTPGRRKVESRKSDNYENFNINQSGGTVNTPRRRNVLSPKSDNHSYSKKKSEFESPSPQPLGNSSGYKRSINF
ncbi:CD226 antigen-like [Polypterus senegalus]|uniref:CD226 antigen-like n=1 Tax=Polypterus senegalus TaxID=55291 RepID=UPI00196442A3|nr:CD226 antigen-like [Polypterus senegalus]